MLLSETALFLLCTITTALPYAIAVRKQLQCRIILLQVGLCAVLIVQSCGITIVNKSWVLDFRATDHISDDKTLFQSMKHPHRKCATTANGTTAHVIRAGTVCLTPSFPLHNCLLVLSLSHHLLSVHKSLNS